MSDVVNAAKSGDLKKLRHLIEERHCDVNSCHGDDCYTALYWAACNGHSTIVFYLLDNDKIDVNKPVKWGSTPLHAASERGHRRCVIQLCERLVLKVITLITLFRSNTFNIRPTL